MKTTLFLTLAVAFTACGSDALGTNDQGANTDMPVVVTNDLSATHDLARVTDFAYTPREDGGPLLCGVAACSGSDKCCISTKLDGGTAGQPSCETACESGSIQVDCRGPSQCAGNPCCIALGSGAKVSNVTCSSSLTDCSPTIDVNSMTGETRLCEFDSDCTAGAPNTQLNQCCTIRAMGQTQHLCFNSLFASFIGGSCP